MSLGLISGKKRPVKEKPRVLVYALVNNPARLSKDLPVITATLSELSTSVVLIIIIIIIIIINRHFQTSN